MDYTCIFFGVLFTIGGIVFATGNGHPHLSAWRNMPPEEKEKIAIVPLCRNIGEIIALNGIIFLLKGLWAGFSDHWFVGGAPGRAEPPHPVRRHQSGGRGAEESPHHPPGSG